MSNINDAPTPQNTPASAAGSYMQKPSALPNIPDTINENSELLKGLLSNNPLLLQSIQAKLGQLVGQDSGYFETLPLKIKNNVYALKNLQEKQYKIEADFQAELLELERKYQNLYKPIFKIRKDLITGELKPTDEEIENGKKAINEENGIEEGDEEEEEEHDEEEENSDDKGVPYFWLTAMQNLPPIADMISERDIEVLESLIDIRMEYMDKPGFKLIFQFNENKYFKNKEIIKTYYYQKELGYSGEFIYDHAEGDEINWTNNELNVTVEIELRKQRNKHTKQVRTIEKTTPTYSFFNFFNPPSMPNNENDEEFEDIDDELEESLQNDYSIGELIKEKLIPRAVDWFTGHALQYEAEFQNQDDEEFDNDDDDDEGEEDEDDDDNDDGEEGGDDNDDDDDDDEDDDEDDEDDGKEKPECKQQ